MTSNCKVRLAMLTRLAVFDQATHIPMNVELLYYFYYTCVHKVIMHYVSVKTRTFLFVSQLAPDINMTSERLSWTDVKFWLE